MNPLSSNPALPARGPAAGRALRSSILWSVVGSLLLAACRLPTPQADPVRYFTRSGPVAGATGGATVRPVQLAGHLRGRQMAVRTAANEVVYLEEVRWAEPLDEAITQVLRARAGAGGAGSTVAVQIQRCELNRAEGNSVQVAATYALTAKDGAVLAPLLTPLLPTGVPPSLYAQVRALVDRGAGDPERHRALVDVVQFHAFLTSLTEAFQ